MSDQEFYGQLANAEQMRFLCADCGCPHWAHFRPQDTAPRGCGCGECPHYRKRKAVMK